MDEKKECLFSIQKMNKYYLLPFLVPFVCYSTKFFSEPMKTNHSKVEIEKIDEIQEHKFVFLYQTINSTSLIFGGLLYIIEYIQIKKLNRNSWLTKDLRRTIVRALTKDTIVDYKRNKIKTILLILLMSIIITVYNIIKGYATEHPQLEKRLYFLFFFTLINLFLFKKQIYSHQILSLVIAFIGMAVIFVAFFYEQFNKPKNNYMFEYDIILLIGSMFYSLYLVLFKYVTDNMSMSPFLCMLLIGILSTLLTIGGYSIFSLIKEGSMIYLNIFTCGDNYNELTNYVCFENFFIQIIGYTIINTILQVLILLVVYYFSPEIFAISDIISPFFSFLTKCFKGKIAYTGTIISTNIAYVIIIFVSFIYNEILVCNFWGLNENTWKAIHEKAVHDYLDYEDNESRDSDFDLQNGSDSKLELVDNQK
jgi:hypothetical protein